MTYLKIPNTVSTVDLRSKFSIYNPILIFKFIGINAKATATKFSDSLFSLSSKKGRTPLYDLDDSHTFASLGVSAIERLEKFSFSRNRLL